MKTRYNKKQRVYVGSVGKYKVIEDIEVFNGLILYYMDDITAYPEEKVFESLLHYNCYELLNNNVSEEEQFRTLTNI